MLSYDPISTLNSSVLGCYTKILILSMDHMNKYSMLYWLITSYNLICIQPVVQFIQNTSQQLKLQKYFIAVCSKNMVLYVFRDCVVRDWFVPYMLWEREKQ